MAVPATRFEVEHSMEEEARLARLEGSTEHVQRDVTEIKGDLRRIDGKIDAVGAKVDALKDSLNGRIDAVKDSFTERVDAVRDSLTGRIDSVRDSLEGRIDSVKDSIGALAERFDGKLRSMEVKMIRWFVGTAIAIASLVFGIAKFVR
jgi:chromosome segregation ATPase